MPPIFSDVVGGGDDIRAFRLAASIVYLASVVFAFRGDGSTAFYHPVANGLLVSSLTCSLLLMPRSRFA